MEQDGQSKSLAERIREKAEQERIQTENVFREQLRTLSDSLTASSQNALRTMSDAMEREIMDAALTLNRHYRLLSLAFARKWITTTILGLFLCLGMILAGWGLMKLGDRKLTKYRSELAKLQEDHRIHREAVENLNKTLADLLGQTSGIAILERNGNRYVTTPPGSESGHTINGRPAIKLKE